MFHKVQSLKQVIDVVVRLCFILSLHHCFALLVELNDVIKSEQLPKFLQWVYCMSKSTVCFTNS